MHVIVVYLISLQHSGHFVVLNQMSELDDKLSENEVALSDLQVEVNNLKKSNINAVTKRKDSNGSCGSCPDIDELKTDIENILRSDAIGKFFAQ